MYAIEEINDSVITVDIRSRLLSDRIIFLDHTIDDEIVNDIIMSLLFLDSKSNDPITIYVSSFGGSVSSGLSLINVMNIINSPIDTVVLDKAMSMAAVILICGNERSALRDSIVMLHGISITNCSGDIKSINSLMTNIEEQNDRLIDLLITQTKLPRAEVLSLMEHDNYINATTAVELNIIDKII